MSQDTSAQKIAQEPKDYDYFANINNELFNLIPKNASRVIEVGCAYGAMGAKYKKENPFCEYIGIEISEKAAKEAEKNLDKVHQIDIEKTLLSEIGIEDESVDCIIYGDVLEHLYDPTKVIDEQKRYLKKGGIILSCIPNIQFWGVLQGLILGSWKYKDSGILDKTHIRFFTSQTIIDMLAEAGYDMIDMQSRKLHLSEEKREEFIKLMKPVIEGMGGDYNKFVSQTSSLQYVTRATPDKNNIKFIYSSTLMLKPIAACNDVRVTEPERFLTSIPGMYATSSVGGADLSLAARFKDRIFIFQRPILTRENSISEIKKLLKQNYLVITEFDDHPERWKEIENNGYLNFRGVHAVQTSTKPLAEYFTQFNQNIGIFPNQISRIEPFTKTDKKQDIRIFFGALNRENDWAEYIETINEVIKKYSDKIFFSVVHDRKFYDALQTSNKTFCPTCDHATYIKLLSECDVSFMPLSENLFNSMKSDLKFIEAAANGVVPLCSPTVYKDSVKDGETGMIFSNAKELKDKLEFLIEKPKDRLVMAQKAYSYICNNRMLSQHYFKRYEWYSDLLSKLPELNSQLRARIPELFD